MMMTTMMCDILSCSCTLDLHRLQQSTGRNFLYVYIWIDWWVGTVWVGNDGDEWWNRCWWNEASHDHVWQTSVINKCDRTASCHIPAISGLSRIDERVGLFSSSNRPRFVISPVPCNNSLSARDCRDYKNGIKGSRINYEIWGVRRWVKSEGYVND